MHLLVKPPWVYTTWQELNESKPLHYNVLSSASKTKHAVKYNSILTPKGSHLNNLYSSRERWECKVKPNHEMKTSRNITFLTCQKKPWKIWERSHQGDKPIRAIQTPPVVTSPIWTTFAFLSLQFQILSNLCRELNIPSHTWQSIPSCHDDRSSNISWLWTISWIGYHTFETQS